MPMLADFDPFKVWDGVAKNPLDAITLARTYCLVGPDAQSPPTEKVLTPLDAESVLQSFKSCWKTLWGVELAGRRKAPFYAAGFELSDDTINLVCYYEFVDELKVTPPSIKSITYTVFHLAEQVLSTSSGPRKFRVMLPLGSPPEETIVQADGTETKRPTFPNLIREWDGKATTIRITSLRHNDPLRR